MSWTKLILVLVAFIPFMTTLHPQSAVAGNGLTPFLSPIFKGICNSSVWCGKGSCQVSLNSTFGFECQCDAGWSQIEEHLSFLPCVVPNCSLNYSCTNSSIAPAPARSPSSLNITSVDPCMYSYCGGGTCNKTSTFEHRCDCKEGFSNLFNDTSFPCFTDCSLGASCSDLGITLKNSSIASPPPSLSESTNSANGVSFALDKLVWVAVLLCSTFTVQLIV